LEPGSPVLLQMSAEAQGDEVRARIQTVETLDRAAAKVQKGLRIFVRDEAPLDAVAKRLDSGAGKGQGGEAEGEVNVIVMLGAGAEVELKLPGRYKVSPQIAGAIKAIPGVVEVRAVQGAAAAALQ
jgi:DNA polymerase-3 subunit alpha